MFIKLYTVQLVFTAIGDWHRCLAGAGHVLELGTHNNRHLSEGLQVEQPQLTYKNIALGTAKSLDLSPDHNHIVVTIGTTRQAEPLLADQTVFWVVKPRLFAGNISGLSALLSGSYVGMHRRNGRERHNPSVRARAFSRS